MVPLAASPIGRPAGETVNNRFEWISIFPLSTFTFAGRITPPVPAGPPPYRRRRRNLKTKIERTVIRQDILITKSNTDQNWDEIISFDALPTFIKFSAFIFHA